VRIFVTSLLIVFMFWLITASGTFSSLVVSKAAVGQLNSGDAGLLWFQIVDGLFPFLLCISVILLVAVWWDVIRRTYRSTTKKKE
jgi:hypothetical protein